MNHLAENYKGFIFDLDGTLYLENEMINGAAETINYLIEKGKHNTWRSDEFIVHPALHLHNFDAIRTTLDTHAREVILDIDHAGISTFPIS